MLLVRGAGAGGGDHFWIAGALGAGGEDWRGALAAFELGGGFCRVLCQDVGDSY